MPDLDPTRDYRITASIVPWLMAGSHDDLQRIFLRTIGDPRCPTDEFEGSWAARFGNVVQELARKWIEEDGYELADCDKQFFHPDRAHVSATLDWRVIARNGVRCNVVMDCKCINAWRDLNEMKGFYAGQLVVQQECAGSDNASLLVVRGGGEPFELPVDIDENFRAEVWRVVDKFWACVESLTPPVPLQFPRIVPREKWTTINLDRDEQLPNWSQEMRDMLDGWANTEDSAKAHEQLSENIKHLFPSDCGRLVAGRYIIARARNNAVRIRKKPAR